MRFAPLMTFLVVCCLIAPAGAGTLIAIDSSRVLYEINMINGVKTQIGTVSSNAGTTAGLARNATNGTIYLTSTGTDELFTVDLSTGTATLVGSYGTTTVVMHGLEWDGSTGTLYGGSNGNLFTIDTTTGFATQVGASGLTSFTNLVHVPTTNTLYATNSGTDSFYLVDRTTGAMTLIGALGSGSTNPNGLAYNSENGLVYMVDNSADNLYTIDVATGAATLIGSTGAGNLLGLVFLPSPHVTYCYGDGTGTACPCGNSGAVGNGCANSINPNGGKLIGSGAASIANDMLVLQGSGMPNSSALYFQGTLQQAGGAGVVFGDGLRCVAGAVIRLGTKTNVSGVSQYPDVGDQSVSVRGLCASGDVRHYQCWYRNAADFCILLSTFNLTNAVTVTWLP
jgi:DNA-binding beta-propeller fold protein YncE